jgi:N-methylhydantoinase A/oxoprolinase/acetone carboxylase beta subunit
MIEEFYKKKVIRDFLSLFSETKWKELIFLCLEYGIILLKRNYNVASLSLDDLNNIMDDLKEEENKRIKQNLKKFELDYKSERRGSGSNTKLVVNKPPSDWRKGDDSLHEQSREEFVNRNESKEKKVGKSTLEKILKRKGDKEEVIDYSQNNIYPEWWGDVKKRSQKKKNNKNEVRILLN